MDYIQQKLLKSIEKTKKRHHGKYSTIVGYYNVLIQYQLYLLFSCVWDKKEPELPRNKKIEYLQAMKRASMGTILSVIMELDSYGKPVLNLNKTFQQQILEFIKPRNSEIAHGILIPGVQEDSYRELAESYEKLYKNIQKLNIPILSENGRIYYMPDEKTLQETVFENDDYDYIDLSKEVIEVLGLQPQELYYYFDNVCYKISPFMLVRETQSGENPYEIFCYQEYNLKNGKFEYKKYSDISDNISYSEIFRDYFSSFQEEFSHTITKANGVICNKFENNYDYFIATAPIDNHVNRVWEFIQKNKSNTCLTIRGGGGIGKTALIQYVCTKKIFEPLSFDAKEIQYVIFCSAKDREFKQSSGLMGHIKAITDESRVRSYTDIIRTIAWVLDLTVNVDTKEGIRQVEEALIQKSGVLLIVDDFETLSEEDKKNVVALSSRLNVFQHKMIITTRSQYMVGEEYYIENLNRDQTIAFMKERFKQSCSQAKYLEFEKFVKQKGITTQIYHVTKGLPMLAIQLGNVLVLNGCKETSLIKREDEEIEDFLLGRLYSYFGTETSKLLFLLIAHLVQFHNEQIGLVELKTIYSLYCERMGTIDIDFEQDIMELKKLNIIQLETDYIRISNYISVGVLRQCQDILLQEMNQLEIFHTLFFKVISEQGMKDGIVTYCESNPMYIDYAFIKVFAFENHMKYTTEVRFMIIEKYLAMLHGKINQIRDLFREACQYLDVLVVEDKFLVYQKKYNFILPELNDTRSETIVKGNTNIENELLEIIDEFESIREMIDDFLDERIHGASQSYCLERMQEIRGKLGSLSNTKLVNIFSYNLAEYKQLVWNIKELMDEISYTREFNIKDNDQYKRIDKILATM